MPGGPFSCVTTVKPDIRHRPEVCADSLHNASRYVADALSLDGGEAISLSTSSTLTRVGVSRRKMKTVLLVCRNQKSETESRRISNYDTLVDAVNSTAKSNAAGAAGFAVREFSHASLNSMNRFRLFAWLTSSSYSEEVRTQTCCYAKKAQRLYCTLTPTPTPTASRPLPPRPTRCVTPPTPTPHAPATAPAAANAVAAINALTAGFPLGGSLHTGSSRSGFQCIQ